MGKMPQLIKLIRGGDGLLQIEIDGEPLPWYTLRGKTGVSLDITHAGVPTLNISIPADQIVIIEPGSRTILRAQRGLPNDLSEAV